MTRSRNWYGIFVALEQSIFEVITMEALLLVLLLILNVAISIWNCYAVGTAWKDIQAFGGTFEKVLAWSGIIQSGVGFSMPVLLGLAYGSVSYLTDSAHQTLTPEEGAQVLKSIFSLWYVAVIFPVLGSGLAIWAHSVRIAYERRDFASLATAGWNTFAQVHNMLDAWQNVGMAMGDVGDLFKSLFGGDSSGGKSSSDSGKAKAAILIFVIVVTALVIGFLVAFSLVRYFSRTSESRIEAYAEELREQHGGRSVDGEFIPRSGQLRSVRRT